MAIFSVIAGIIFMCMKPPVISLKENSLIKTSNNNTILVLNRDSTTFEDKEVSQLTMINK